MTRKPAASFLAILALLFAILIAAPVQAHFTGSLVTGFSFYLQRNNIPIPEFGVVIALVTALGASLVVLRRRRIRN